MVILYTPVDIIFG